MKDCECMKGLVDDLVVTCDDTVDAPKSASVNPSNEISYWFIAVVLLAFVCLLSLVAIVVTYHITRRLKIPCLLSY